MTTKTLIEAASRTRFTLNLTKLQRRFRAAVRETSVRINHARDLSSYLDSVTHDSDRMLGKGTIRETITPNKNSHPLIQKYS